MVCFRDFHFIFSRNTRQWFAGRKDISSQPFQWKAIYLGSVQEALWTVRTGTVLKNRATQACTSLQIINYNFFSRYKSSVCIPLFLSLPSPALLLYIRLLSRISPQSLAALSKHNRAKSRHETWIRSSLPAVFSAQIPSCSQHRILLSCSKPLGAGSFSINTHSSTYLFKVIILNWSTEDINL